MSWSTGWGASIDPVAAWQTYGSAGQGWSTSWEDASRELYPKSKAAISPEQATSPGSAVLPSPASPPVSFASLPVSSPQEWAHVTSAESWTDMAQKEAPATPTKQMNPNRPTKATSPTSSPPGANLGKNHGPLHHDIEDEIGHQDRYKTELCRSWMDSGSCRYGTKCQFAHGSHELRPIIRHPKYKTEMCRSWAETKSCPYGRRCRFIHEMPRKQAEVGFPPATPLHAAPNHQPQTLGHVQDSFRQHTQPPSLSGSVQSGGFSVPAYDLPSRVIPQQNVPHGYPFMQNQGYMNYPGPSYGYMSSTSPPYAGSFGNLFNSSPPLSPSVRAANAPWMNDVFQDDEDEDDFMTLQFTPLIEQLNLAAEPVSPSHAAHLGPRPAPIGQAPVGTRPNVASSTFAPVSATNFASTAPANPNPIATTTAPSVVAPSVAAQPSEPEKSKKKKSSRLGIFQRLSSNK